MRERVLQLIKEYLAFPNVQNDTIAVEALNALAGDIRMIKLELQTSIFPGAGAQNAIQPTLNPRNFKLCYVADGCAYFTSANLQDQWGDDWNDAPSEHNAGTPYENPGEQILKIEFTGPFQEPCQNYYPFSVQLINRGFSPWLRTDKQCILAGATPEQFREWIRQNGGQAA